MRVRVRVSVSVGVGVRVRVRVRKTLQASPILSLALALALTLALPLAPTLTYRRALAAEPSDARYVQGLGTVLHEAGRAEEAVTHYLSAQRIQRGRGERSVELERDLSAAMREAGRLAEAVHVGSGLT